MAGRLSEVVRYDRASKWAVEWDGGRHTATFGAAVEAAKAIRADGGEVFYGLPGGNRFDGLLKLQGSAQ